MGGVETTDGLADAVDPVLVEPETVLLRTNRGLTFSPIINHDLSYIVLLTCAG